ncbi:MAG: hypothetical protein SP4CHLAM5_08960 [Chlamydiia bacterium]|nr:hypothetical protein [Chlamydiia bacterium]MCH9618759.1 hypothetical protein [Chlamydiia bacterium]MCH9624440.1 hypothetical protein [Chlamydiia bacterium]
MEFSSLYAALKQNTELLDEIGDEEATTKDPETLIKFATLQRRQAQLAKKVNQQSAAFLQSAKKILPEEMFKEMVAGVQAIDAEYDASNKRIEASPDLYKLNHKFSGGQKKGKEALRLLNNPQEFLKVIKEMKRQQQPPRSAEDQAAIEAALLAEFEGEAPKKAPSKKTSKKKKGKRSKKGKALAGRAIPGRAISISTDAPLDCAEAGPQISPLQRLVQQALSNTVPKKDAHKLHGRVRRWDARGLTGKMIADWKGYTQLTKKERVIQVIKHMGIGLHKLLDSPKLYRDYVFESERGPIMWCTIETKDKDKRQFTGKIHFGVEEQSNGKRLVYHRMFTEAEPGAFGAFIDQDAPEEVLEEEEDPQAEEVVGRIQATALANGELLFKLQDHAYIKEYTIHRLV